MKSNNTRPATLIDNWLTHYGYDKNRSTGDNAVNICYTHISEWNGIDWVSRWRLAGANESIEDTVREAFEDVCSLWREEHRKAAGDRTIKLNGILLMAHGEGRWAMADPDTGKTLHWDDLSEEQRTEALDNDPEFQLHLKAGSIPVRVVNIVTDEGLGGEVSMFFPDEPEPHVERHEQWVRDDIQPEPQGRADEVLMSAFGFLLMLREVVVEGEPLNMEGLTNIAMKHSGTDMGRQVLSLLLRFASEAVADGSHSLGDWWSESEDDD